MTVLPSNPSTNPNPNFLPCQTPLLPSPPFPIQQISRVLPTKPCFRVLCSSQNPNLPRILRRVPDWADAIKETRMHQKRRLYKHGDWVLHRSSLRHLRHLSTVLSSRVILSLVPPVTALTSVAAAVAAYNSAVDLNWLPPEFFPVLRASSLPYQLTAPALALLLVFRTEASYSRLEEGRKAWSNVIAGANNMATQVMAVVDCQSDALLRKSLLQYIMVFPVALKCHLVYGSDIESDLKNLLEADDLAIVLGSKHPPRCIIEFISHCIRSLTIEETKLQLLESKISCFHESLGACEQLVSIPIPLSYTRLTSRFLVLWHLTLPIIIWDECHWMVIPATFISSASLFCIEEVGVLIEEPFPMLALDELCNALHESIRQAMANEKAIQENISAKRKAHFTSRNGCSDSLN
ncbi:unnamed protein product [Cuscuta campestris]|uniref:Uncharacterized protein n=1 Tax=Cuscuta campestris TaxID=132261 RepID=A0A484LFE4_9ASTE|nr:unnamed protein product [Cuscuta campestris]